jgi:hypothetical protein
LFGQKVPRWEAKDDKCWEMEGFVVMQHREREFWNVSLNLINSNMGEITTEDIFLYEKYS